MLTSAWKLMMIHDNLALCKLSRKWCGLWYSSQVKVMIYEASASAAVSLALRKATNKLSRKAFKYQTCCITLPLLSEKSGIFKHSFHIFRFPKLQRESWTFLESLKKVLGTLTFALLPLPFGLKALSTLLLIFKYSLMDGWKYLLICLCT